MELEEQIRIVEERVSRMYADLKNAEDEAALADHINDQLQVLRMLKTERKERGQCHATTTFH